jgi:hypothetical protein
LQDINNAEVWSKNDKTMFAVCCIAPVLYSAHADVLEAVIFRDMNILGSFWFWYGVFWPAAVIMFVACQAIS